MAKRYLGGGVSFEQKGVYQEFSEDSGGGSSTLSGLTDVDISNPSDGQTLVYNATSDKWENGAGGGGGGVLVCHVDFTTFALDKTYREVVNADVAVLKSSEEGTSVPWYLGYYEDLPAANSGAKAGAKAGGWTGHMAFVNVSGAIEGSALPKLVFVASDPDDYPVMDH